MLLLLAIVLHRLWLCCDDVAEDVSYQDALAINLTIGRFSVVWIDGRQGKILYESHQDVYDDFCSDALFLDHRLSVSLEELQSQVPFDSIPRGICVIVPGPVPEIVTSRILSGVAKFRGIVWDRTFGSVDGSVGNIEVVPRIVACSVGCVALHKEEFVVSSGDVQYHLLIDFGPTKTQVICFYVSWDSPRSCDMRIISDDLVCDRLSKEEMQRNPYLTSFIQSHFEPLMRQVVQLLDASCSQRTRVSCALVGTGADSGAIQSHLSSIKRLSVWLPTKDFHDCCLEEFGAGIIAASLSEKEGNRLRLQVRITQTCVPKFSAVLDLLGTAAAQLRASQSFQHASSGGNSKAQLAKAVSYSSLYSLHDPSPQHTHGMGSSVTSARGIVPSAERFHRPPSSDALCPQPSGTASPAQVGSVGCGAAGQQPHSSGGSKRSFRSLVGSGSVSRHSNARDNSSSDVSLSALNEEEDEHRERVRTIANPTEDDEDFQAYY